MPIHRPLHIVLDFDGTITTKDTIEPLVQSAIALRYPCIPSFQLSQTSVAEAWNDCKSRYLVDLSAYYEKDDYLLGGDAAVMGPDRLERVQRSLEALWDVEWASVRRVGESGIFRGISEESLREKGSAAMVDDARDGMDGEVVVRKGFREFVRWIEQREATEWGVVSVNWSHTWVRGVLDAALGGDREEHGAGVDAVRIMANEIDSSTGMIEGCKLDAVSCAPRLYQR
jgi:thiamine phosphate phosphatase / amino-HMP aminohydrolase